MHRLRWRGARVGLARPHPPRAAADPPGAGRCRLQPGRHRPGGLHARPGPGGCAAGRRRRGRGAGPGAGSPGAGHPPPGRTPAVALPVRRPAAVPLHCAAGVRRPHPADARRCSGPLRLLGETIDDAAGEAFDKSAKLLGLGYPGGPALSALAAARAGGRLCAAAAVAAPTNLDFSFAGLKTAVAARLSKLGAAPTPTQQADMAASVQAAIVEVLCAKSLRALQSNGLKRLVVAGGVGADRAAPQPEPGVLAHRRPRVLPRAGSVHRQRRDDRAGRGHALAARPGRR